MLEWAGLSDLSAKDAIVLVLALPYLLLATGRLVPYRHVRDWKDAYFRSEDARTTDRETTSKLLGYAEAADHLLRTSLPAAPSSQSMGRTGNADDVVE